jgi:hypothetical protein
MAKRPRGFRPVGGLVAAGPWLSRVGCLGRGLLRASRGGGAFFLSSRLQGGVSGGPGPVLAQLGPWAAPEQHVGGSLARCYSKAVLPPGIGRPAPRCAQPAGAHHPVVLSRSGGRTEVCHVCAEPDRTPFPALPLMALVLALLGRGPSLHTKKNAVLFTASILGSSVNPS